MDVSTQQMEDVAHGLQTRILPAIEDARKNLEQFNTRAVRFIKANPGTCLIGALAIGFVVGRIASR